MYNIAIGAVRKPRKNRGLIYVYSGFASIPNLFPRHQPGISICPIWICGRGARALRWWPGDAPWREELENALEPAEEGLYTLKPDLRLPCEVQGEAPRFVISGEISSIYKKNGKTSKVHSVILLPDLASAQALSQRLEAIGNIHSDGRPILGLDCRDLLEIALDACPSAVFIPAHIWTPHFSLLGAFSGFDSLEECFGDLSGEIHAVETGLSSDPPMNWRVPDLDGLTLVSNSDAHSPAKLGREANLLDCALSYPSMAHAIQTGEGFCGTLEFYPEEGKYHLDGHRNCGVCLEPSEARKLGDVCPVCGRRLTIGVLHRVEALALRPEGARPEGAKPFESLVPLPELLSASLGAGAASRRKKRIFRFCARWAMRCTSCVRRIPWISSALRALPRRKACAACARAGCAARVGSTGNTGKFPCLNPGNWPCWKDS